MEFNFEEFLTKGNDAANKVINNKKEIQEVLVGMKTSLSKFLNMELEIVEETEYEDDPSVPMHVSAFISSMSVSKRKKTGFIYISIKHISDKIKDECYLFRLKRSPDGYPIIVAKDSFHIVSENQKEFSSAIGEILADAQTHIMLKQYVRKVMAKLES